MSKEEGNSIAVIGDSHAGHLFTGLDSIDGIGGVATFSFSCSAPYIDISTGLHEPNAYNVRVNSYKGINAVYEYVLKNPGIKTVLLAHNPRCSYNDTIDKRNSNVKDANLAMRNGMIRTFKELSKYKKRAIVVLDNPVVPYDPKLCADRPFRLTRQKEDKCSFPRSEFDSIQSYANYKLLVSDVTRKFPDVSIVDLSEKLCEGHSCYVAKDGVVLYQDQGHLNDAGSKYVAMYIYDLINKSR